MTRGLDDRARRDWRAPAAVILCLLGAATAVSEAQEAPPGGDAPQTGDDWLARAARVRGVIHHHLNEAAASDAEAASERKNLEFVRGQLPEWEAKGWKAAVEEARTNIWWMERRIPFLERLAEGKRGSALAAWRNLVKRLESAADSFARDGQREAAARALVLAAEAGEGDLSNFTVPPTGPLARELRELSPPAETPAPTITEAEAMAKLRELVQRLDPQMRAEGSEAAAKRLRNAADQLEGAGLDQEAQQRRAEANAKDAEASRLYEEAAGRDSQENQPTRAEEHRRKAAQARERASTQTSPPPSPPPTAPTPLSPPSQPAPVGPTHTEDVRRRYDRLPGEGAVVFDLINSAPLVGEFLWQDYNFPQLPVPEPTTQKMIVDSVTGELDPVVTIADRGLGPSGGRWSRPRFGLFFAAFSPQSPPREPAPAPGAFKLFFASLGRSTGEAFDLHVVGTGPLPERITFHGLVVEPLKKEARRAIEAQVRKLAGAKRATARVDAYCLEFLRLPPEADMVFRIAPAEAQRAFAPVQRVLAAARHLRDAGALSPDSDPVAYFHSIRQWAVWTREQGFDEGKYAHAFVEHTRKNLESAGGKWKGEMKKVLLRVVPGRWRDIQRILAAASGG
jgi:hypothetical protein